MPTPIDEGDSLAVRVRDIIVEQLGITNEEVTLEASLVDDLRADSLDLVEIIMALEEGFEDIKLDVSDEDAEKITTVGEAIDYIRKAASKAT